MTETVVPPLAEGRRALARSVGLAAFVYGYPLVESVRTCRLQTSAGRDGAASRAPINRLHHIVSASTDRDRDIVTPANDLLYTTAWIHLADGPQLLTVPAAARHPGRYFVLALYDAYTENFENLGLRNGAREGESVLLVGPAGDVPESLRGHRVVRCPTQLVWLIGRILVADADDLPAARRLQSEIRLEAPASAPHAALQRRPASVEAWDGEPVDAMSEAFEQGRPAADVAPRFYRHLSLALAEAPGRSEDQGLVAWFGQAGLRAGAAFSWDALDAPTREGLVDGFADAVGLVAAAARSRSTRPWVLASRAGRYGSEYLVRALTAYIGLGALATDEALYGAGHFDAQGRLLDGSQRYTLRFAADEMPPAEAFWSVTLYDADRFLYRNEYRAGVGRHSIGDRTQGLRREPDGSLVIDVSNEPPADVSNWLPAPRGRFYLILRLYHPRADARSWKVPPLEVVS